MSFRIERCRATRTREVNMTACINDPIPGTSWYAHEHRVECRVEVYLISLDTIPILDFENRLVSL
jgi:hypothetical protein